MNNGCTIYNTKNWELVFHAQVTNEELDKLNEAVANYPDVCLTLTGEKHYYAVGEEVPELVQYDAGLVFDTAHAVTLDEMKATDEIIFKLLHGKSATIKSISRSKETALAKEFSVVRARIYL